MWEDDALNPGCADSCRQQPTPPAMQSCGSWNVCWRALDGSLENGHAGVGSGSGVGTGGAGSRRTGEDDHPGGQECPMPLRFCRVHVLHRLWGGQPCCRPAFRPAGPAEKRVRRLKSLPHGSDTTRLVGLRGCVASKKNAGEDRRRYIPKKVVPSDPISSLAHCRHARH